MQRLSVKKNGLVQPYNLNLDDVEKLACTPKLTPEKFWIVGGYKDTKIYPSNVSMMGWDETIYPKVALDDRDGIIPKLPVNIYIKSSTVKKLTLPKNPDILQVYTVTNMNLEDSVDIADNSGELIARVSVGNAKMIFFNGTSWKVANVISEVTVYDHEKLHGITIRDYIMDTKCVVLIKGHHNLGYAAVSQFNIKAEIIAINNYRKIYDKYIEMVGKKNQAYLAYSEAYSAYNTFVSNLTAVGLQRLVASYPGVIKDDDGNILQAVPDEIYTTQELTNRKSLAWDVENAQIAVETAEAEFETFLKTCNIYGNNLEDMS